MTAEHPRFRLVITDLDNTLYDWVTFFATSFTAMADSLAVLLDLPVEQIYSEFKAVHQRYGNSEQPFAALELPSVLRRFPGAGRDELLQALANPLKAFNSARKRNLKLYPTVLSTLQQLRNARVEVVGYSEAVLVNSYYRLQRLDIAQFFRRLYALEDKVRLPSLSPGFVFPSPDFVQLVPRAERKPNPRLLIDICAREQVSLADTLYIGDSLVRDISMAKEAGVCAVWAKYGTRYDRTLWKTLVKVTHWTEEDVAREEELEHRFERVQPDYSIEEFSEISGIIASDPLGNSDTGAAGDDA
jgi:FMN phosphatase YigB (HAD superfamily)